VTATLSVTVDVDGEAGLPDGGRGWEKRLSSRSERTYGLVRGLPRVLKVLDDFDVPATFYVPGVTAERHPDEVRAIIASGHELGHHGHTHRRPDLLDPADQRSEIAQGLAALAEYGQEIRGYRAPGWELTPATLAALPEHGLQFDSSLMGDDEPYIVGGVVELPVHWSLDDAPYFASTADPQGLTNVWLRELELTAAERRPLTVTLHPEILGRPHRVDVLRRLLERVRTLGVEPLTHGRLAGRLRPTMPAAPHPQRQRPPR
jgi:peptidoglycan-N-acetylglucosamine deacetylase